MVKKKIASVKIPEFLLFFFSSVFLFAFFRFYEVSMYGWITNKTKIL